MEATKWLEKGDYIENDTSCFGNKQRFSKALECYDKANKLYHLNGDWKNRSVALEKCIECLENMNDPFYPKHRYYNDLVSTYLQFDKDKAIEWLIKSNDILLEENKVSNLIENNIKIGELYNSKNMTGNAIKYYEKANYYLGIDIKKTNLYSKKKIRTALAVNYMNINDYKKAYSYYVSMFNDGTYLLDNDTITNTVLLALLVNDEIDAYKIYTSIKNNYNYKVLGHIINDVRNGELDVDKYKDEFNEQQQELLEKIADEVDEELDFC